MRDLTPEQWQAEADARQADWDANPSSLMSLFGRPHEETSVPAPVITWTLTDLADPTTPLVSGTSPDVWEAEEDVWKALPAPIGGTDYRIVSDWQGSARTVGGSQTRSYLMRDGRQLAAVITAHRAL